jgi:hypothetical protein
MLMNANDLFQFHTGSIKSNKNRQTVSQAFQRFNSILVRLKDQEYTMLMNANDLFQFHTGSIKRSGVYHAYERK